MLSDEKILITGPAGQIAFDLARYLAADNEVWGIARFRAEGSREKVEAAGVVTRAIDLAGGDFRDLPRDFTYVLHLAAFQGPDPDYDEAMRVNAEGTGLLLGHCQRAKAALVMSTHSVYQPHDDPFHAYRESDALGDVHAGHSPTYSVSKIGQEAVARYCARAFGLRVVIARMNASYGPAGGLPTMHLDAVAAGNAVTTRWEPCPYQPIYQDDINDQTAAILGAAAVPAIIVNWAGDETVSVQQWCAQAGELCGTHPDVRVIETPGTLRGSVADTTRRRAITGPCRVGIRDGLRRTFEARYPERALAPGAS